MGLDITAYRKLTRLDALFNSAGDLVNVDTREVIDDYFKAWENPDFPGRAAGLEHGGVYDYLEAEHVFSLGYGGYSRWRETLAMLAGYPLATRVMYGVSEELHAQSAWSGIVTSGDFYELVNFSDCEGCIGPVVAAKLASDFAKWDAQANAIGGHFYERYCDMRRGLEIAADGGALHFH